MLLPLLALLVFSGCSAPARYIPDVSADAAYRDGVFTLSNFHLYGNYIKERRP